MSFLSTLFRVTPEDIIYCTLPLYHTAGGSLGVGSCLVQGNTVVLRRKFSASKFWDDCVRNKATVCEAVCDFPSFYDYVLLQMVLNDIS